MHSLWEEDATTFRQQRPDHPVRWEPVYMSSLCRRGGAEGCSYVEKVRKGSSMSLSLHKAEVWRRPVRVRTSMEDPAGKLLAAGLSVCASCTKFEQRTYTWDFPELLFSHEGKA